LPKHNRRATPSAPPQRVLTQRLLCHFAHVCQFFAGGPDGELNTVAMYGTAAFGVVLSVVSFFLTKENVVAFTPWSESVKEDTDQERK
jgi:hypothetical protein